MTDVVMENALWELQRTANVMDDPRYAQWVLYAVTRYIYSARACPAFEDAFVKSNKPKLMEYCLHTNDYSDDNFIKRAKSFLLNPQCAK